MKITHIALMLGVTCALTACGDDNKEKSHSTSDTAAHTDAASQHGAGATDSATPMELKAEDTTTETTAPAADTHAEIGAPTEAPAGGEHTADTSAQASTTMDVTETDVKAAKSGGTEHNMDGSVEASATMDAQHGSNAQTASMTTSEEEKLKAQAIGFTMTPGQSHDAAGGSEAKNEGGGEGQQDGHSGAH